MMPRPTSSGSTFSRATQPAASRGTRPSESPQAVSQHEAPRFDSARNGQGELAGLMAARRRRYNTMARAIVFPGAQLRERALDAGDHQGARPHRASERLSIVSSPWPSAVELGLEEQAGGRERPAPARRCVLEETDVAFTSTGTSTETLPTCHRGRAITNPPSVAPCRWPGVPSAPPWAPRRSPPGVVLCRCQPPELPPRCPPHARGLTPQRALALSSGLRSRETPPSSQPPRRSSSSARGGGGPAGVVVAASVAASA